MRLSEYQIPKIQNQDTIINGTIIYCRKSSESDERQIQSLPDQILTLTNLVASKGLQVLGEPLQEAKSAKVPGRPIFNKVV